MDERETYKVYIRCRNCDITQKCILPKGQSVADIIENMLCEYCGCCLSGHGAWRKDDGR